MKPIVALTLLGVVAAGCGSASRLSPSAYRARLAAVAKEADKAQHSVEQALQAKTPAEIRTRLTAFAAADDRIGDELGALKPPKDAEAANAALAQAEHNTASAVRSVLPRLARAKTAKAAIGLLQHDQQAAKAGQQLDAALSRLHKLGYTQGS